MKIYQYNESGHWMCTVERDFVLSNETEVEPNVEYPKWDGSKWITDTALKAKIEEEALRIATRNQDIGTNLPSWQEVSDSIDSITTIAGLKVAVKKIARVVYWLAKNKVD